MFSRKKKVSQEAKNLQEKIPISNFGVGDNGTWCERKQLTSPSLRIEVIQVMELVSELSEWNSFSTTIELFTIAFKKKNYFV